LYVRLRHQIYTKGLEHDIKNATPGHAGEKVGHMENMQKMFFCSSDEKKIKSLDGKGFEP